ALSASGRGDINLKMKRAGIKAYVPKPFDPKQLQEVIINFLSDNNEEIQGILQSGSADSTDEDSASTAYVENNNGSFDLSNMLRFSKQDPEVMEKLTENSLKSLKKYREEFEAAADAENVTEIEELIHKNTMTLHMIKAEKLTALTENFKDLLHNGAPKEYLRKKRSDVLLEFDEVINGLKSY